MIDPSPHIALLAGLALAAYLMGSLNISILACRLLGIADLRASGSGNPGATNLLRAAGWKVAVPVLLLDFAKAFGTVFAARLLAPPELAPLAVIPLLLGNLYPVFHGFKGGKGVAATVGAFLAVEPLAVLAGGGLFLVVILISRRVSAGSILMVTSYPTWMRVFEAPDAAVAVASTVALAIVFTHRANIGRLLRGTEPRIGQRHRTEKKTDGDTK